MRIASMCVGPVIRGSVAWFCQLMVALLIFQPLIGTSVFPSGPCKDIMEESIEAACASRQLPGLVIMAADKTGIIFEPNGCCPMLQSWKLI